MADEKKRIPTAKKRHLQSEKRRLRNRWHRSRMRTEIKKLRTLIDGGDAAGAKAQLPATVSMIQHVSSKGVIHRNQAARRVSRLTRAVNGLAG